LNKFSSDFLNKGNINLDNLDGILIEIIKSTFNTSVQKKMQNKKQIANGYTKDGVKIYKRLFEIKKIK
tara:strand:- start:132 stop:335 length:204 start_codon:yes stop_codon:yes gene_type:complete